MHLINSTWLSFTLFILIEIVRDFSQDYHFGTKKKYLKQPELNFWYYNLQQHKNCNDKVWQRQLNYVAIM